ncbi:hypothetical protein EC991_007365 [Linnemannia zychae]|nr:hypothetical protein EC991_007365 [Linnemannia zychae]
MTQDNRLTLFCVRDGDILQNAFPIKIDAEDYVGNIQSLIKDETKNENGDISASKLNLWRVSIPVTDCDTPILLSNISAQEKEELDPFSDVLEVFPDGSPDESTYVIYKQPLPDGFKAKLDKITGSFFNPNSRSAKFLKEFVQGCHVLPDNKSGVSGLPTVMLRRRYHSRGAPTLLFFHPASFPPSQALNQAERILTDHPEKCFLPLSGVRGCGKTRTAMELLSRYWGLYINACPDEYGSEDMTAIIENLSMYYETCLTKDKKKNTARVRYTTFGLLYARLLILEHCLSISGSRDTFTCQRWMLLQVATPAFQDVFLELAGPVYQLLHRHEITTTFVSLVREQFATVRRLLHGRTSSTSLAHSKFLLVLDESHQLSRFRQDYFVGLDGETVQPVLYPVLSALMDLEGCLDRNTTCVLPCNTGISSYEPQWMGDGSVSENGLSDMVIDFAGLTNVASITDYLKRLGGCLDDGARERLEKLVPPEVVLRLFRDMGGRFGHIVYVIQDIIMADKPREVCLQWLVDSLTEAVRPNDMDRLQSLRLSNWCARLTYAIKCVSQQKEGDDKVAAMTEIRGVEALLRAALSTFKTQGAYLAVKGLLSKSVEIGFSRFTVINGEIYTTIDESLTLRATDNYFQMMDGYNDCLGSSTPWDVATLGREGWAVGIPHKMVQIFHGKVVSTRLFLDNNALIPQEILRCRASIVGWSTHLRTRSANGSFMETTMDEFLDAHLNKHSECDGNFIPPFFYPGECLSRPGQGPCPDIVFVVRFEDSAMPGSYLTSSPESSTKPSLNSNIICPVVVQVKLCKELSEVKVIDACFCAVETTEVQSNGFNMRQYCRPVGGYYIQIVVGCPSYIGRKRNIMDDKRIGVAHSFDDDADDDDDYAREIDQSVDESNTGDFSGMYAERPGYLKRSEAEMTDDPTDVKRARV